MIENESGEFFLPVADHGFGPFVAAPAQFAYFALLPKIGIGGPFFNEGPVADRSVIGGRQ